MAHSMKRNTRKHDDTPLTDSQHDTPPPETVDMITKAQAAQRGSNISDQTIREYCVSARNRKGELDAARKGMQEANGRYRAVLKEAKKAGVDPAAVIWWLESRGRDPEEIDRETRSRNRVAKLMGLPIFTQLGLFDDDTTVATAVDQAQLAAEDRDPYKEGYSLGWAGKAYSQGDWEGDGQVRHLDGWQAAQHALVGQLGTGDAAAQ